VCGVFVSISAGLPVCQLAGFADWRHADTVCVEYLSLRRRLYFDLINYYAKDG